MAESQDKNEPWIPPDIPLPAGGAEEMAGLAADVAYVPIMGGYSRRLPPGDYEYCTCGRSTKGPFCDGFSHEGTVFLPHKFTLRADRHQSRVLLCGCRYSTSVPFCDGSHISLDPTPTYPPPSLVQRRLEEAQNDASMSNAGEEHEEQGQVNGMVEGNGKEGAEETKRRCSAEACARCATRGTCAHTKVAF